MKALTFLTFIFVVISAAKAQNRRDQFIGMISAIEQDCLIKENISNYGGSSESIEEEMEMKVREWHCFLECVASDMGIVSDTSIN